MTKVEAVSRISEGVSPPETSQDYVAAMVGRLRAQLYARALFLTQQKDAADDLVQEVCERALRFGERFQIGTNLAAWLNRIMHNLFVDGYRERRRFVPESDWDRSEVAVPPHEQEATLYDLLSHDDVLEGLAGLAPRDRQLLELALFEHRSYKQLAAQLGMCIQTVGTRIHRAKKRLKAHLMGLCGPKMAVLRGLNNEVAIARGAGLESRLVSSEFEHLDRAPIGPQTPVAASDATGAEEECVSGGPATVRPQRAERRPAPRQRRASESSSESGVHGHSTAHRR